MRWNKFLIILIYISTATTVATSMAQNNPSSADKPAASFSGKQNEEWMVA